MATLIGDFVADPSRFHPMLAASPGLPYQQQSQHSASETPHYRSPSRPRDVPSRQASSSSPSRAHLPSRPTPSSSSSTLTSSSPSYSSASTASASAVAASLAVAARHGTQTRDPSASTTSSSSSSSSAAAAAVVAATTTTAAAVADKHVAAISGSGGASRFPSPPDSSSSSGSAGSAAQSAENIARSQHGNTTAYMESSSAHGSALEAPASSSHAAAVTPTSVITRPPQAIPSPPSDIASWVPSPRNDIPSSPAQTQTTIRIRDLAHIQSLARTDLLSGGGHGILNDPPLQAMKYEISDMPIGDIIEMVAALLTKITTTNDLQHDALNRNANHVRQAAQQAEGDGQHHQQQMSPLSSSVLAFHGKNVPAITILSYLSRIHKYCPTTYEVFLSLLVYFDRMTERVNDIVMKAEEARRAGRPVTQPSQPQPPPEDDVDMPDDDEALDDDDLADDDDSPEEDVEPRARATSGMASGATTDVAPPPVTFFVVDSFNIHRLIIAGVTCASKFFSDVFYTNSRYAKVGGLPLAELNHLELQFLLLNDFRLAVPVEDLEAYATMLVEFYAREVVSQRSRPAGGMD